MKNLNLSDYTDGLGVDEINGLLARMNELRAAVESLEAEYSKSTREGELIGGSYTSFEEDTLLTLVSDVDDYFSSLTGKRLFDISRQHPTREDFVNIISQYKYLMSEK